MVEWWKRSIIYQIYPRSFNDTTGNGIGDIQGIIEKLDYIKSLNCDAIWLCPIYPSPQKDFGYDVSDYTGINPEYGSLEDFDQLVKELHQRDMKLIMDFVPNHTSDQHFWFQEAMKSRDNPYRDYYIWKDPAPDGGYPNNWESQFGGPGWSYHEPTGQYYFHQFVPEQPEVNYENPKVLDAMKEWMRLWYKRGVDGLRLDTCDLYKKDQSFVDETIREDWDEAAGRPSWEKWQWTKLHDVEGNLDIIKEFRSVADEFEERFMIGEIYKPFDRTMAYYGDITNQLFHAPTNMTLVNNPFELSVIRPKILVYYSWFDNHKYSFAWPNWQFSNHDRLRMASRIPKKMRLALLMLFTLRGTPITYYGDEIGMENGIIPFDKIQDPFALTSSGGLEHNRDKVRTPMQWNASEPNAGFSTAEPWLPVHPNYIEKNVETLSKRSNSLLSYFRELTQLRQETEALYSGSIKFHLIPEDLEDYLFVYSRMSRNEETGSEVVFYIIQNFSEDTLQLNLQKLLDTDKNKLKLIFTSSLGHIESSSIPNEIEGNTGWILTTEDFVSALN